MREILFRAKRIDDGKWVEGYYAELKWCNKPFHVILPPKSDIDSGSTLYDLHVIDPETLCQFTGLTDKNGKHIWENDIISINTYDYTEPQEDFFGWVMYSEGCACWCIQLPDEEKCIPLCECEGSYQTDRFIEGNVFDNLELLEEAKETGD